VRLAGARNAEQAISNAAAMDLEISKEELTFIDGELGKL
jgi:aryl-alcohol dehydrogenase-like predicted oxidoreductase